MTLLMQRVPRSWVSSHIAELLFHWIYAGEFPHFFHLAHPRTLTIYAVWVWAIFGYDYHPPDIIQRVWDAAVVAQLCFLQPELKEYF